MIDCVDWDIDHAKRTITVTIRIDFYDPDKSPPDALDRGLAKDFAKEIEKRWKGRYKCYDFRVVVDYGIVDDFGHVRKNALDVALDGRVGEPQTRTPGPRGKALSDDPADRLEPERSDPDDFGNYTAWPWFGRSRVAHEAGHVLGLDDGYVKDEDTGKISRVPGHVDDIMFDPTHPVTPETITRVVRRHGGPEVDRIRCPLTLDSGPSGWNLLIASLEGIQIHAWTCDYPPPSNDPAHAGAKAEFQGRMHVKGEYLKQLGIPLSAEGEADIPVSFFLPIGEKGGEIAIDAQVWVLRQNLWAWDPVGGLPIMLGPLVIHAREHGVETPQGLDSSMLWPGPPLYGVFTHGAPECGE